MGGGGGGGGNSKLHNTLYSPKQNENVSQRNEGKVLGQRFEYTLLVSYYMLAGVSLVPRLSLGNMGESLVAFSSNYCTMCRARIDRKTIVFLYHLSEILMLQHSVCGTINKP